MLKPTPYPKATPISTSQSPSLYYLELFPVEKECLRPHSDGIKGAIQARKAKEVGYGYKGGHIWLQKGSIMDNQGVSFQGCKDTILQPMDHGGGHVGLSSSLGLVTHCVCVD